MLIFLDFGGVLRRASAAKYRFEEQAWVAIDDDPLNYPPLPNVLLVDPECGFDGEAAAWLLDRSKES
jgi:hypothetical protein